MKEELNEKPIITIEEKSEPAPHQGQGEVPVIIIERDETPEPSPTPHPKHRWRWVLGTALITTLCLLALLLGRRYYLRDIRLGVPVAVTAQQNIQKLEAQQSQEVTSEVIKTNDSILSVPMNFYELRGLQAEIAMCEPDTADASVYLYCRCSDYHSDFSIIGDLVIGGEEMPSVESDRIGYFAAVGNRYVIGIAKNDDVKDFALHNSGYFFRQFVLLSDGTLPRQFYLHGKVERRGIGRMSDDRLYYIETLGKETMWDFADALREYGFVDAIYITGGKDYCYYRSADGERHDIGRVEGYPHKYAGQIPWLVFRKR